MTTSDPYLLPQSALWTKLAGSAHPEDALIHMRNITDYLMTSMEWYGMSEMHELPKGAASGLALILSLLHQGLQECFEAAPD